MAINQPQPFWKTKTLEEMTREEWESLCDGCGICCLYKLEDEDTGEILYTNVACRLLDPATCRCKDYEHRNENMPTCLTLTPELVGKLTWMPQNCSYRRIYEGKDLFHWHPLISNNPDSVHFSRASIRGRMIQEANVNLNDLEDFIVDWVE